MEKETDAPRDLNSGNPSASVILSAAEGSSSLCILSLLLCVIAYAVTFQIQLQLVSELVHD